MTQLRLFDDPTNYNPIPVRDGAALHGPDLGRARIEEVVNKGRTRAARVIEYVQKLQPVDKVVKGKVLRFKESPQGIDVSFKSPSHHIHQNALRQIAQKVKMPTDYLDFLLSQKTAGEEGTDHWGAEHVASILNDSFKNNFPEDRFLTRSVENNVRGFLSDRFRRMDSRVIFDAAASACQKVGALPYEGYVSDTKVGMQAIIPNVYEPIPGEIMAFGVSVENSDFGNGALNIMFFLLRLICLNGAIGQTGMRHVHLGKRLEDDINWSSRTYDLDAKTVASAVGDMITGTLSPERIEASQEVIRRAYNSPINPGTTKSIYEVLKKAMSKDEVAKVIEKFNEPDVELLPPGNNLWRMSNAVSWLANQQSDDERKLELMKTAGKLLPAVAAAA